MDGAPCGVSLAAGLRLIGARAKAMPRITKVRPLAWCLAGANF